MGFLQTQFNDFNKAIEAVRQGHYWGVATIRANFSQAVKNKFVFLFKLHFILFYLIFPF